jgi:geranylgeranylglycerol-phosphate geranylgeranyltransferase
VFTLRAILRLTRIDSSLLGALAIFLPLLVRTKNLGLSVGKAIPLLFIGMCTFIANDLDDREKDRVNHPDRPLPAHQLTPEFAAVLYFTLLGAALFSTRHFVAPGIAFWYYGLMTLSISYGYIVECLQSVKTTYVAAASSVPVLIVAASYPNEPRLYVVAATVFLLTLGREICGDILDRAGDAISYMHRFRPISLAVFAFFLQLMGLLLLAIQILKLGDIIALLAMTFLLALAGVLWFRLARYRRATLLMKIQFFVGLYFLL